MKERYVSEEIANTHKAYLEERGDEYNPQNPFSKILRGEMPSKIIKETPDAIIIQNQVQRTNVYHLALPVYPAKDLFDFCERAPINSVVGYVRAIQEVIQETRQSHLSLTDNLKTSVSRIVFNIGPNSQNTVPHLHAHLMTDENFVDVRHLTLSQALTDEMGSWLEKQENVTGEAYEKQMYHKLEKETQVITDTDMTLNVLKDGQQLGWKECSSLVQPTKESVYDLLSFLSCVMSLSSQKESWGGRAVLDIEDAGRIMVHASGNALLRKLPLTPLTQKHLSVMVQNSRE